MHDPIDLPVPFPRQLVPTNATECASVASVLRRWPVAKTLARADISGGTSRTLAIGQQPQRISPTAPYRRDPDAR